MLNTRIWRKLLYLVCAAAVILASCSSKEDEPHKPDMNAPFVLKVGAGDVIHFMEDYYEVLAEMFPQMEVQVVQAQEFYTDFRPGEPLEKALERTYQKYVAAEQPDVLVYSMMDLYRVLGDAGLIESLDPLIKRDQYDMNTLYKPAIDKLRANGDGQLYGIAPFFTPEYITYFNYDLFNRIGVPVPQAPYTWNQLIELGGRFAGQSDGDEPLFGFALGCAGPMTTGQLVIEIGKSKQLELFNDDFEMTFQTDAWRNALEPLSQAIMSGAYQVPEADASDSCFATMKNTAIVVSEANNSNASLLKQAAQEGRPINVHMDVPPSPEYSLQLGSAQPRDIFSIVKGSPVVEQAWEVIKAINEESGVKKLMAIEPANPLLPTREGIPYEYNGSTFDNFYGFKDSELDAKIPSEKVQSGRARLRSMITQEFTAMKNEGRTLEEVMDGIQQKGNEILLEVKAE